MNTYEFENRPLYRFSVTYDARNTPDFAAACRALGLEFLVYVPVAGSGDPTGFVWACEQGLGEEVQRAMFEWISEG